ncbi:hypothetical protein NL676_013592 [Syzygium grande]|nr:hypothetical protein NL676_013592 [Syzygium grande]
MDARLQACDYGRRISRLLPWLLKLWDHGHNHQIWWLIDMPTRSGTSSTMRFGLAAMDARVRGVQQARHWTWARTEGGML